MRRVEWLTGRPVLLTVANDEMLPSDLSRALGLRSLMMRVIHRCRESLLLELGYCDLGGES